MSAVSEEDVLAVLIINAVAHALVAEDRDAMYEALGIWALSDEWPAVAVDLARLRMREHGDFSLAIADSERRWEVERSQREVIRAAYILTCGGSPARLYEAVREMNRARREARMQTLP